MTLFQRSNFSVQKKLLRFTGLWPTPDDKLRVLRVVAFYAMYVCNMSMQFSWMFEFDCNLGCVLYVIAIFSQTAIGLMKYITFHSKMHVVQSLFVKVNADWKFLENDKVNLWFLQKYTFLTYIVPVLLVVVPGTLTVLVILIILFATPPRPPTVNCTQFWNRPVVVKEPNLQVCRSPLIILMSAGYANVIVLVTAETTFMVFSEHVCVMLKLAGYHLKHATVQNVYSKTVLAVQVHIRALKFINRIWNTFAPSYMLLIGLGTVSASTSIMSLHQTIKEWSDERLVVILCTCVSVNTMYGILTTYYGQRVINHSLAVFSDAYESNWYEFPLDAQKFYLIVMERSIKCCSYSKRGLFVSSLEGLASLVSTTFSYAAVFLSLQN